ncbi:MAG: radical SAM protein [Spirochaetaceae bacterium]|nr:radical SAM protein [Spirochaetaceae bacterium]
MKIKFIGFDDLLVSDEYINDIKNNAPYIMSIGLCLNSSCIYNCIYCYARNSKSMIQNKLNFATYKKIILEAKNLDCKTVIITGVSSPSEPLESEYLIDIIKLISKVGMKTVIYSNAYILGNDILCKRIHKISSIELARFLFKHYVSLMVSCDSIYEDDYNKIVQNNAFSSFKIAERNLCEVGFLGKKNNDGIETRIAISTVISKININYLGEMQNYFHNKNWQFICKFPSLMGNTLLYKNLFFSSQEVIELKEKTSNKFTDKTETLAISSNIHGEKYCLINQLGIAIDGEGHVLSCLSGNRILRGKNIHNTSLKNLIIEKRKSYKIKVGVCPKKLKYYKVEEEKHEDL